MAKKPSTRNHHSVQTKMRLSDSSDSRIHRPRESRSMKVGTSTNPKGEFVFFDVVYEDDSQRSNRRVPADLLGGLEKDEPARGFIIGQDREIAEKSNRPPLGIKSIARTGAKKK
jgi:hypothetical protein